MTVDVSLCGSIPRSHMPHLPSLSRSSVSCRSQALSREPPSLPRFLSTVKPSAFSRTDQSSTDAASGSSSSSQQGSSHQQHYRTIDIQTQSHRFESSLSREKMISLAASSLQQQSNGCNLVQGQQLVTPIEPPSWAVAAKGESRLEVSFILAGFSKKLKRTFDSLWNLPMSVAIQNSPYVRQPIDKRRST